MEAVREVEEQRDRDDSDEGGRAQCALRVLDDDVRDHVGSRLAGVERTLKRLVDVLPADHDQRVDTVAAEQRRERVAEQPVAFVLARLQLDQRLLNAAIPLRLERSAPAARTPGR